MVSALVLSHTQASAIVSFSVKYKAFQKAVATAHSEVAGAAADGAVEAKADHVAPEESTKPAGNATH